jgi:hypothetical protein
MRRRSRLMQRAYLSPTTPFASPTVLCLSCERIGMSVSLKQWCGTVHQKHQGCRDAIGETFPEIDDEVRKAVRDFVGVKTGLEANLSHKGMSLLKASLFLSDFTSFFPSVPTDSDESRIILATDSGGVRIGGIPETFDWALPGQTVYSSVIGEKWRRFVEETEPLAMSGRLMIRPAPSTFLAMDVGWPLGIAQYPDSPLKSEDRLREPFSQWRWSIPFRTNNPPARGETRLLSMRLPYIDGLSFSDLAKLLDDEEPYLGLLRAGVRQALLAAYKESKDSSTIFNDVIRPAVEKIQMRFRTVESVYKRKIRTIQFCTTALTLASLASGAPGKEAVAALAGTTGLLALAKEAADREAANSALRELPFYLLWRVKELAHAS